jgi:hypothetical protein
MSVRVDRAHLRYALAVRLLSHRDLARKTGLSDATVSVACAGEPIAEESLKLIVAVLRTTPIDELVQGLLGPCVPESTDDPPPESDGDPE